MEEVESPAYDLAAFPAPHVVSLKDCGNVKGGTDKETVVYSRPQNHLTPVHSPDTVLSLTELPNVYL